MSYLIAFIGGILTFISPCILPMIPIYLAYITGVSVKELTNSNESGVKNILFYSIMFVIGFTIVFTLLAVILYTISNNLGVFKVWLIRIAGVIVIIFGLHTAGFIKLNFLDYQAKFEFRVKESSILKSVLLGMSFGAGWSPCVGPILAGILFSSIQAVNILMTVSQLIVYSLGIGIPFILTGVFVNRSVSFLKFFKKHARGVELTSGIFIIVLGILLTFDLLNLFSSYFSNFSTFILQLEQKLIEMR